MRIYIQRIKFGEDGRLPLSRFYQLREKTLKGNCADSQTVYDSLISEKPGEIEELTRLTRHGKDIINSVAAFFGPYSKGEIVRATEESTTTDDWLGWGRGYGVRTEWTTNKIMARKSRTFGEVLLITERADEIPRLQRRLGLSGFEKMSGSITERVEGYPIYWNNEGF